MVGHRPDGIETRWTEPWSHTSSVLHCLSELRGVWGIKKQRTFQSTSESATAQIWSPTQHEDSDHTPNFHSQMRCWRNAYWFNKQEEELYFLETSYISAHSLGFHGNSEKECCCFQLIGQGGEAERWCCQDLNSGLFKSQIHIHFPVVPLESLIQILILSPKKEQNLQKT